MGKSQFIKDLSVQVLQVMGLCDDISSSPLVNVASETLDTYQKSACLTVFFC